MDSQEYGPGTPQYNDKKWAPMTKGLTSREAVFAAHVMEQEARHLNRDRTDGSKPNGASLKYVFPTLRVAVPKLLDGDLDLTHVHKTMISALETVLIADLERPGRTTTHEMPSLAELDKETLGLATRAKSSIEGLRGTL